MALTAKQAHCFAYALPGLAVAIAIGAAARPTWSQAISQTGNSERTAQMVSISKDIQAKRCYQVVGGAPIKGNPVNVSIASLHSSCLYGSGWYGFIAVLDGQVRTIEVFTSTEIKNTLSTLKDK